MTPLPQVTREDIRHPKPEWPSLRFEPEFLHDRPPFHGVDFLQGSERLRCELFAWENLNADIGGS